MVIFPFFSLASSSATIAVPRLGGRVGAPDVLIDSATCDTLLYLGDHLVSDEAADDEDSEDSADSDASDDTEAVPIPSLVSRVSARFKRLLRRAYAEINCLDDNSIVLSYLNGNSPYDYPDQAKWNRALLMFPSNELIELEYQRFSSINSAIRASQTPDVLILN